MIGGNDNTLLLDVKVKDVNGLIGINVQADHITSLLEKMQLGAALNDAKDTVTVTIPITRSDILHPVDIIEDVAIAYGEYVYTTR